MIGGLGSTDLAWAMPAPSGIVLVTVVVGVSMSLMEKFNYAEWIMVDCF